MTKETARAVLGMAILLPAIAAGGAAPKEVRIADLKKAVAAGDAGAIRKMAVALLERERPEDVQAVIRYGFACDNWNIEREIAGLLSELSKPQARAMVLREARSAADWRARVVLAAVLGQWAASGRDPGALPTLNAMLRDRVNSVVLATIVQIRKLRDASSVGALIECLAERERRGTDVVWGQVTKALEDLTGQRFEIAADWRNWWAPRRRTFDPRKVDPRKVEKTPTGRTVVKGNTFFGHEIVSKKLLFILDVSGSMSKRDPLPEEAGAGGQPPPSRERLRRVQAELIQVIRRLPPDVVFNIIAFNHKIKLFSESPLRASATSKLRAIRFAEGFKADGETHTDTALERAFEMKDRIDTIYLLSDGAPRRDNKLLDTRPILRMVRRANRFRKIIINTVGIEQAGTRLRRFMGELARQNYGEYRELR